MGQKAIASSPEPIAIFRRLSMGGREDELERRIKHGSFKPMPKDFFQTLRNKQQARFKATRQKRAA
jgi:hypothetical protein